MATIVAASGGGSWNATATWTGAVVPTAADNVQLASTSGAVTVNVASVCRSLDCTGYVSTLTIASGITLSIGDATAGTSNIALKLVSGMTLALGSATTSALTFVSTSTTSQTITTAGKTLGALTLNGAGGVWALQDATTTTGAVTLTAGTFNVNSQTCSWLSFNTNNSNTRTLTLGSVTPITITSATGWVATTLTNFTMTSNSATITMTGTGAAFNSASFDWNGMSVVMSGAGAPSFNQGTTVTLWNFTRTGTALNNDALTLAGNLNVYNALTLTGNSANANRLIVQSNGLIQQRTLYADHATISNTDFSDINGTSVNSGTWSIAAASGGSGDALGNSGITFTTAVTRYAVAAGNWTSTSTWAATSGGTAGASVPLPQDSVVLDANSGTGTYVVNAFRLGANITCTGFTGTLSFTNNANLYGNVTFATGMTISGTTSLTMTGRGTHTITTAGRTITMPFYIEATLNSVNYTFSDAFASTNVFQLKSGNMSITQPFTCTVFTQSSSTTWNGTATISVTSTAATAIVVMGAFANVNGSPSLVVATASANARSMTLQGKTFGSLTYTVSGSTGALTIAGGATITDLNFFDASNARTLTNTASTTLIVTGTITASGTSGKLISIISSTAGTAATISKASGLVFLNYVSIKDSTASGGATFFAGANSTNVSGNTGWRFAAPPSGFSAFF